MSLTIRRARLPRFVFAAGLLGILVSLVACAPPPRAPQTIARVPSPLRGLAVRILPGALNGKTSDAYDGALASALREAGFVVPAHDDAPFDFTVWQEVRTSCPPERAPEAAATPPVRLRAELHVRVEHRGRILDDVDAETEVDGDVEASDLGPVVDAMLASKRLPGLLIDLAQHRTAR